MEDAWINPPLIFTSFNSCGWNLDDISLAIDFLLVSCLCPQKSYEDTSIGRLNSWYHFQYSRNHSLRLDVGNEVSSPYLLLFRVSSQSYLQMNLLEATKSSSLVNKVIFYPLSSSLYTKYLTIMEMCLQQYRASSYDYRSLENARSASSGIHQFRNCFIAQSQKSHSCPPTCSLYVSDTPCSSKAAIATLSSKANPPYHMP